MEPFNPQIYKKTGVVITKLARDLLTVTPDTRLLSVTEYAGLLGVSRGLVQKALAVLEENNAVITEKSHGTGTKLISSDEKKLCEYAGWDSITINMPMPLSTGLAGMATAFSSIGQTLSIPINLVYATGSETRLRYLEKGLYDAILVSRASAEKYQREVAMLAPPLLLPQCVYGAEFCAYFSRSVEKKLTGGLRVAVDLSCNDYTEVAHFYCKDYKVNYVEVPLMSYFDALNAGFVDLVIHRREIGAMEHEDLGPIPICLPGSSHYDTPALLFNREKNYGMRRYFKRLVDVQQVARIQRDVICGKMSPHFF